MSDEFPPPTTPQSNATSSGYSVGEAFNYGWVKFQSNLGPILIAAIIGFVVVALIEIIGFSIAGSMAGSVTTNYDPSTGQFHTTGGGGMFGGGFFVLMLFYVVAYLVILLIQAGIIRASLAITRGETVSLAQIFSTDDLGPVVIASILVGLLTFVGLVLCVIPGLIAIFFTGWTLYFVVDKKQAPVEAIKSSVAFVNKNVGSLIGFFLASIVAYFLGALLCGVGLLVAIPVVVIGSAYTFRKLQDEAVVA